MRKITTVVMFLILISMEAFPRFRKVGTTGYVFLEIPVTARMSSMGEVSAGVFPCGAGSIFTNPSLVSLIPTRYSVHSTFADYIADIGHKAFSCVINTASSGAFGISLNVLEMGDMLETVNADPLNPGSSYIVKGTFSADAFSAGLTYSRKLTNWFAYGLTIKFVRERIASFESRNMLMDVGMIYLSRNERFRIGGYMQNFGVDTKYIGDSFKMPMIFRLGVSGELLGKINTPSRLTVAVDAIHPSDYSERLNVGLEYCFKSRLFLRGGYKFNYDEEGWTAGFGTLLSSKSGLVNVDVSYACFGRLGNVTRVSVNIGF
ncbi:MAG: PorV/PorQ family protein [Candidatus Marinimicrobia bacterium]|nr:PorV/PorQ family protein [Candidatus Neomarinimicrobiota bacterium]